MHSYSTVKTWVELNWIELCKWSVMWYDMMHTSLFQTKVQHIITSTKSPLLGMEGREYLVHTVVIIQRVASHHNTTQVLFSVMVFIWRLILIILILTLNHKYSLLISLLLPDSWILTNSSHLHYDNTHYHYATLILFNCISWRTISEDGTVPVSNLL